ncbi:MAG TPA: hypothetical protein VKJ47_22190, partial [Candidatus Binatia bacterium]|nr:hypothetical protein [Candidatus Binatia bacterium]
IHAALTLAKELAHPFSLVYAIGNTTWFHQFRRERHLTQEKAEAAIALSNEQGFALWSAWASFLRDWALAEQGQREEGVAQMYQSLAAFRATGAEQGRPYCLALLAEMHGKMGQTEEGLTVLAEALALVDKTGERFYEPELYRLKGQLVLQSGVRGPASENPNPQHLTPSAQAEAEAEACFLRAIEVARRQQAKSLELRATVSLARLWQKQDKREEARQMLAEIYGWFTEGFDTVDLQEARALLDELDRERQAMGR